ncbi:MAG: YkgJ family cysteine cluster protein [Geobacteraceae bacterium]
MIRSLSVNSKLLPIVEKYSLLLKSVDLWFAGSAALAGTAVQCGKGCSSCCRGLFDITLLDAYHLRQGIEALAPVIQKKVLSRMSSQIRSLRLAWPEISPPYIINILTEEELYRLMPEADPTPCPLLGENGLCLVYEHRPMTCRLHGIPLIDTSGESFHDEWCSNNFTDEVPLERKELRWQFRELFRTELSIFQEFMAVLLNQRISELDTLIPAVALIDFDGFDWEGWWLANRDKIRNGDFQENRQDFPPPD